MKVIIDADLSDLFDTRQDEDMCLQFIHTSSLVLIQFIDYIIFYLRGRVERIHAIPKNDYFPAPMCSEFILPQFMQSWTIETIGSQSDQGLSVG